MKKCFVVCPIGQENSETRKRSDKLFKHIISPVCKECDFESVRIDKENTNGSLTEEIIEHLIQDDLVIADLTEYNPNAFYEIGYRAALKKPAIHLISKDNSIPFDISVIRTLTYDLSDLDSVEELKERLIQTIQSINSPTSESAEKTHSQENQTINMQILQEIYKVQDDIIKLTSAIESKDSAAISVLADKLADSNTKTPESTIMELFLKTFLEDPSKLLQINDIINKLPNQE